MTGADAWVRFVGKVLTRSHTLFADPPASGSASAASAGAGLSGAANVVRAGMQQIGGGSGQFAQAYGDRGARAAPELDTVAGLDAQLSRRLGGAVAASRAGHAQSGAVLTAAAADTAALGPVSGSPAGERVLLTALRARLLQQQRVIAAYRVRDARMAAMLRSLSYGERSADTIRPAPTWTPSGTGRFGGPPGVAGGWGPNAGPGTGTVLAGLTRRRRGESVAGAEPVDGGLDPRAQMAGPGGVAVAAALTKLGSPYVWGAKGPSSFDCSGLTHWAWAQAGVSLGPDTYSQIDEGVPVPPGEVQAGDLIFPSSSFDGRGPGHVQLDVVRVAPLPSSYVARRPVREL
jgi:cell wall-associated NlpC family hydrolase